MNDVEALAVGEHGFARPRVHRATWIVATGASLALFWTALSMVARGALPQSLAGAALTASYVAALVSAFRAWTDASILKRHGFWLLLVAGLLYLPTLGTSSLWDPWETHYGEVAREILVRRDWISLWWAHQGFFYSKPALLFWIEAIAMAAARIDVTPGHVLLHGAHPEWVVRMPNVLLALGGLYLLYRGAAASFGRRAAFLGGLVLVTMPYFYLIAHQAITDMPFVAFLCAAMGMVMLGLSTSDDRVTSKRVYCMFIGAVALVALPQALYLITRNVDFVWEPGAHGFHAHADEFRIGSGGGNCVLPGNVACGPGTPAHPFEPFLQGLAWLAGFAFLAFRTRHERRVRRLTFLGAWIFAALATLAKGPAGLGLPVLCLLTYVAATKRWSLLFDLEIASGLLVVAIVALPWYVAAYVRHGTAFTDELLFNDMINRAFSHVHDTNEGDDTSFRYYLNQLGYGLFPWSGLAPIALGWALRERDDTKRGPSILLFMWFLFAFALFATMGTKFHHYIFPAVPPLAMLVGVMLDDWLEAPREAMPRIGAAAFVGACLVGLVAWDLARHGAEEGAIRFAQLFSYQYKRPWPAMLDFHRVLTVFGLAAVLGTAAFALRRVATPLFFTLAVAMAAWGIGVYLPKTAPHWGQGEVMRAYYSNRASEAEPLVAYQMNWKGEAFYTGNRMATFVTTGAPFTKWLRDERERGMHVVYFVVEPSRVAGLKNEAQARAWREVTTREQSHQFVLVRAEL